MIVLHLDEAEAKVLASMLDNASVQGLSAMRAILGLHAKLTAAQAEAPPAALVPPPDPPPTK